MDHKDLERHIIHLQGRSTAADLLLRNLYVVLLKDLPEPIAEARRMEAHMLSSLQNIQRPEGEYYDAAMGAVAETLREFFFNIEQRMRNAGVSD